MFRVVLGDYIKKLYGGIELQINYVHWWDKELELWEQTYNLVIHWQTKKRFRKLELNTVSLLSSTDKEVVVKMFNLIRNGEDLIDNLQVFKEYMK